MALTDDELKAMRERCEDLDLAFSKDLNLDWVANDLRRCLDEIVDLKRQIPIGWEGALKEQVKLREKAEQENEDLKRRLAEQVSEENAHLTQDFARVEKERDEALAKLADYEATRASLVKRMDEARAEAAAYRKLLDKLLNKVNVVTGYWRHQHTRLVPGAALDDLSNRQIEVEEALSQPGPGAAYQERMRKLEAVATTLATLDCGDNSCYFVEHPTGQRTNGGCHCFRDSEPRGPKQAFLAIKNMALAALEEKP